DSRRTGAATARGARRSAAGRCRRQWECPLERAGRGPWYRLDRPVSLERRRQRLSQLELCRLRDGSARRSPDGLVQSDPAPFAASGQVRIPPLPRQRLFAPAHVAACPRRLTSPLFSTPWPLPIVVISSYEADRPEPQERLAK